MKRMLILFTVFTICVAASGQADNGLTIVPPKRTKMTDAEVQWMVAEVQKAYPKALERVAALYGTDKTNKIFSKFYVQIRDLKSSETGLIGRSNSYGFARRGSTGSVRSIYSKKRQSVALFAQPFFTGVFKLENVLTHEMLHVVLETKYGYVKLQDIPSYVNEGISYYGEGRWEKRIQSTINNWDPEFTAADILKSDSYSYLRQVSFFACFKKEYGDEAAQEVLDKLFKGKNYKRAFETAAGEDWKTIKKKCRSCLKNYLILKLMQGGPYQEFHEKYYGEKYDTKYEDLVQMGEDLLEKYPDSIWRPNTCYFLARSYAKLGETDKALKMFEDIRTGKIEENTLYTSAAKRIVTTLARSGRCEEAEVKRKQFTRLYPSFWVDWREELDTLFDKKCAPETVESANTMK